MPPMPRSNSLDMDLWFNEHDFSSVTGLGDTCVMLEHCMQQDRPGVWGQWNWVLVTNLLPCGVILDKTPNLSVSLLYVGYKNHLKIHVREFVNIIAVHISVPLTSLLCIFLKVRDFVLFIFVSPRPGLLVWMEDRCRGHSMWRHWVTQRSLSDTLHWQTFICELVFTEYLSMLPAAPRVFNWRRSRDDKHRKMEAHTHHYRVIMSEVTKEWLRAVVPSFFGTKDRFCGRQFFHTLGSGGWFQDDSSASHSRAPLAVWPGSQQAWTGAGPWPGD